MQTICLIFLSLVVALGQSDFEALLQLKNGLVNDISGGILASWDSKSLASSGCPQNWYGVTCVDGNVTSLVLDNVGLNGNFSFPVLAGLKSLQNLSISNNKFMGTISNIGSLNSLEVLDISSNLFHGYIPSTITNLKSLVLLNLSSNYFSDVLPSSLGNLEALRYLDLRGNGFSGDVMNMLSQLGSVIYVDLSNNRFSGSLDLGLGNSSFITSIQYLNVSNNSLVGQLFAHDGMPYFDSLEVFDASNNQFVGTIPPFEFVVSLKILRLGRNQLSGSIPEALLQESSMVLSELDLSLNQLEGPLGSLTSATLKSLNISSNKLSGSLPVAVGHCAIIDLSNNILSGNISRIQAWGNYVEVINLNSNLLTGSLPSETSQFLRLKSLRISNNSLNGNLPPVWGTYPELEVLDLSHNSLCGPLLLNFFNSNTLTDLTLSFNNFTGSIPLQGTQNMNQNLSLVSLDLSHNFLEGFFPPELRRFHYLVYLNLSNNKFEGSIPNALPYGLEVLDLSSNNLSGVVPGNLQRFPDSAFHPGNSLLIFPGFSMSPKSAPDFGGRKHRSPIKRAVRIALIASMIVGTIMVALLCILIAYSILLKKNGTRTSKGDKENTYVAQENLPHNAPVSSKSSDKSLPPVSPSSPPSKLGFANVGDGTSLAPKKLKENAEQVRKDEGLSSPLSLLSSSNPSPSISQLSSENPAVLKVCSPDKLVGELHLFDSSVVFTAEELSCAPAEVIGRSCHGTLYKATLESGKILAVKWLKEGMAKGRKEFAREAKKLGDIKHPNLLTILGYYWDPRDHEKMIISSYINAQSLAFYLKEAEARKLPPLSLDKRLGIAINLAQCLNYLHNERAIPHGNLKSSNILLESPSMNAILTDYSLHRILTSAGIAEQVLIAGAVGYMPPEFSSLSKPCPSLKSDVYAFGVILLELVTGKSSGEIALGKPGGVELTNWGRFLAEENLSDECFDGLLRERQNSEARKVLHEMLQVAITCILPASERPDIKSVYMAIATAANLRPSN